MVKKIMKNEGFRGNETCTACRHSGNLTGLSATGIQQLRKRVLIAL